MRLTAGGSLARISLIRASEREDPSDPPLPSCGSSSRMLSRLYFVTFIMYVFCAFSFKPNMFGSSPYASSLMYSRYPSTFPAFTLGF